MRFLIDANLPRSAVEVLQKFGHQVEFARDIGLAAAPDEQIATHAQQTKAVILTRDLDFADVRRYPPEQYHGIFVLRLPDTDANDLVRGRLAPWASAHPTASSPIKAMQCRRA